MAKETEMTKERLRQYKSNKAEIWEINCRLQHLGEGDSMIGNDTILDYGYYPPKAQAVVGVDWEKVDRTESRYYKRIAALEKECDEIEAWIEEISDSLIRRIFELSFIDGLKQKEVAEAINIDRSRVSRKIDDYLKFAHKAQKAHV